MLESPPPFSAEKRSSTEKGGRLEHDQDDLVSARKHFHHGPLVVERDAWSVPICSPARGAEDEFVET